MARKASPERSLHVKPLPRALPRARRHHSFARTGPISFDEFCAVIHPEQKADLIDGVIYVASPENYDAHRLYHWLVELLQRFPSTRTLGEVFGSRAAFRLSARNSPEPDIAFVRKERLHLVREAHFEGAPDLVIEIVSPESVERDYVLKRALYEQHGVREYWIVDAGLRKITLLRMGKGKEFREVRPSRGVLRSQVLTGFWLRPEWLWARPRPDPAELVKQITEDQ